MPYKLSLLLSLFFIFSNAKAQTPKEIIELKAEVLGLGNEINDTINKVYGRIYFTRVQIRNTQDTAISFYILSCPSDISFLTDDDSVSFRSELIGCDMNGPVKIVLQPKQRLIFNDRFFAYSKTGGKEFKLGFVMLSYDELMWNDERHKKGYKDFLKKHKITWSDKIILRDTNTEYYIESF